jgi:hypothetical protein
MLAPKPIMGAAFKSDMNHNCSIENLLKVAEKLIKSKLNLFRIIHSDIEMCAVTFCSMVLDILLFAQNWGKRRHKLTYSS